MPLRLIAFALPLALFAAPAALAQQGPPAATPGAAAPAPRGQQPRAQLPGLYAEPVAMMVAAFDRDGDGKVTRAEFDDGLRHSFELIDTRHAGHIGYIAFGDWQVRWLGNTDALPSPFELDRDGDNQISYDELADWFDGYFKRTDKDGDGVLTRAELLTVRPVNLGNPEGSGRRGKRRGGGGLPGG